jgi:CRP/FNR family cyclic AMP-dependent transcriptional regulator
VTDPYPAAWEPAVQASFLGQFPVEVRADILAHARETSAEARQVLYPESSGYDSAHLLLVLSGLVRVYRTSRSGRELTIRHARTGDVVGLPSMVAQASPGAVQAVVATSVIVLSLSRLRQRAQRDSRVAWAIAEELAGSLFNIQERLAHNVFGAVRSRVARYLLDIGTTQEGRLVADTSHEDIAASIGTVREVVARTVATFRQEGLLGRDRNAIIVYDIEALRRIAQLEEFADFRNRR